MDKQSNIDVAVGSMVTADTTTEQIHCRDIGCWSNPSRTYIGKIPKVGAHRCKFGEAAGDGNENFVEYLKCAPKNP